ncbi:MAG TPA: glycosyltransferase family 4 protein [Patescibacteria group bacterium]|nr:glycosyltransferase family 4 protein [Patescibacteria group bacterium]
MKRICHFTSAHSGNDIRILVKECESLVEAGMDVHLVYAGAKVKQNTKVTMHCIAADHGDRTKRMVVTARKVYRTALSINADLYHFHDPELLPYGVWLAMKGKKTVYDSHEDLPRQILSKPWIKKYIRKPLAWGVEKFENVCVKNFAGVIGATPLITERFAPFSKHHANINNYPRLDEFESIDTDVPKEEMICYIGGISLIRGIEEMVTAMDKVNARLSLAGTFESPATRLKVSAMSGWDKVQEMGQVDRRQVGNILNRAKAGLVLFHPVPNHINAQPNKLFEYMAAGIPVIASNFPLWREVVEKTGCGICVDPLNAEAIAEAIQSILNDPLKSKKMGENGKRAIAETFNWNSEREKLLSFYREII